MADNVVCGVCGGREFAKEAGFYYCTECQTQTCELREQEYELEQTMVGAHRSRTTVSRSDAVTGSSSKQATELASWEVFNHVLAGLTSELVQLGAHSELREVARLLWLDYLRRLGIVSEREGARPQLGLAGRARDERIVYNKLRKRRVRSRAASSASGDDARSQRRLLARNRRILVRAEYERESQTTTRSLADVTLSEVSSDSEAEAAQKPRYNRAATRALSQARKRKCVLRDSRYWSSVWALRRDKLYALLCLAAQVAGTDGAPWLPGELLRACQDGHLSFLSYGHFLPPGAHSLAAVRGTQLLLSQYGLRRAMKLLTDLFRIDMRRFTPDIPTIVTRYCKELNLPDEIRNMAVNLVHNVGPMFHKKRYHEFPNYEGRAMSFILYTLKLLFGLDGQTELQLSRFACDINQTTHENMFVFSTWLRHIEYRKIVLAHQHFPTSFQQAHDNASRMNLFTNFLRQHKGEESLEHNNLTKEVVNKVLTDLEICENSNVLNGVDFPYDRCPTSANLTTILQKCGDILVRGQPLQKDILCDFSHCNLDYVFNSNAYLQKLPHKTDSVVRKGARQHCVYTDLDLSTDPRKQEKWKEDFQRNKLDYLYVDELENFVLRKKLKPDPKSTEKIKSSELNVNQLLKKKNTEQIVGRGKNGRFCPKNSEQARQDENYHNRRRRGKYFVSAWTDNPVLHEQTHNSLYEATGGRSLRETAEGLLARKRSRTAHHRPDRELWMLCVRPTQYPALAPLTRLHWRQLRDMLSPTFRAVLAECAQVCGHKQRHLYREFALVEMYVNYVHLALPATAQDVSKQIPALFPLW